MIKKLASLIIRIAADGAEAEKVLRTLEKSVGKFGKNMKSVGDSMSKYITAPLTALAGVSVAAANTQLQAEAKLLTALKGREDAQRRLIESAAELQSRSTLGDEVIIDQQAYLAALGLTEQQINATIEAAAQLSYATGMELEGAVKNLAKTYSGLTGELGESIPALKELSAEELKAGAAIEYVGNNYKGFAEAAATTGAGPMLQLKNQLGDLAEQIGITLLPILQKLTEWMSDIASWLQTLSPGTMEWVVGIGAAVAALGPLLSLVGKLTTMIPALGRALTSLVANPISAAVTAIGVLVGSLVAMRMETAAVIREAQEATKEQERRLRDEAYDNQRSRLEGLSADTVLRIYNKLKAAYDASREALDNSDPDAVFKHNLLVEQVNATHHVYQELISAQNDALKVQEDIVEAQEESRDLTDAELLAKMRLEREESKRLERLNDILDREEKIASLRSSVNRWREETKNPIQSSAANLSSLTAPVEAIDPAMFTLKGTEVLNGMIYLRELFSESEGVAEAIRERSVSIANSVAGAFQNIIVGFGKGLGDLMSGNAFNPFKMMIEAIGNMLVQLGTTIVSTSELFLLLKSTIGEIGFGALSIPIGIAAIAAGQALLSKAQTIKLAQGGLAYGPTLAVVGDNPGAAHDPEVVAPLSKLRQYMGGMQLELVGGVQFELHGDAVRAILNRENIRIIRRG